MGVRDFSSWVWEAMSHGVLGKGLVLFRWSKNSAKLTVPGGLSMACRTEKAIEWDESWSKNLDPLGRAALGVDNSAYNESITPIGTVNLAPSIIDNMPRMMDISAPEVVIQSKQFYQGIIY
nr:asparagine synthetase [glutamine-hydrolyzing] [Tanacetum cinerariifolium]